MYPIPSQQVGVTPKRAAQRRSTGLFRQPSQLPLPQRSQKWRVWPQHTNMRSVTAHSTIEEEDGIFTTSPKESRLFTLISTVTLVTPPESAEFMNRMMAEMWVPFVVPQTLRDNLSAWQEKARLAAPKGWTIELTDFSLGVHSPYMSNFQVFNDAVTGRMQAMECDMDMTSSSMRVVVRGSGPLGDFRATVSGMSMKGKMRVLPMMEHRMLLWSFLHRNGWPSLSQLGARAAKLEASTNNDTESSSRAKSKSDSSSGARATTGGGESSSPGGNASSTGATRTVGLFRQLRNRTGSAVLVNATNMNSKVERRSATRLVNPEGRAAIDELLKAALTLAALSIAAAAVAPAPAVGACVAAQAGLVVLVHPPSLLLPSTVRLAVRDNGVADKTEALGIATLNLDMALEATIQDRWLQLGGSESGELRVRVAVVAGAPESPSVQQMVALLGSSDFTQASMPTLQVVAVAARNLPPRPAALRLPSPNRSTYCGLTFGGTKQVTPVAMGSQNPTWNFAALFPLAVSEPPQPQADKTQLLEGKAEPEGQASASTSSPTAQPASSPSAAAGPATNLTRQGGSSSGAASASPGSASKGGPSIKPGSLIPGANRLKLEVFDVDMNPPNNSLGYVEVDANVNVPLPGDNWEQWLPLKGNNRGAEVLVRIAHLAQAGSNQGSLPNPLGARPSAAATMNILHQSKPTTGTLIAEPPRAEKVLVDSFSEQVSIMAAQKKRQEEQEEQDRRLKEQAGAQKKDAVGPAGSTDGAAAESNGTSYGASPDGNGSVIDSIAASAKAREARDEETEKNAESSGAKDGGSWLRSLGGGLQGLKWGGGKGSSK
ncbi:hypothetical protein DUNSADRAFT_7519 [Dunaliella salina]|uniref:C2 domain-containing protein n=1 Tax=Dunaliella salina TaxID=3046 RepID=A0ABQ7GL65_DUNSA|nr:hypothetical protein DUNSADRAFT_7519 [Dunaliella salina]|eukprot:KAF5835353.1 hypothetical protein DUNSADRAFT_7519 [Dunaliella salina]